MADVKIQLGINFLDKDVDASAITKRVQAAINTAIAKVNLDQLKKKFEKLDLGALGSQSNAGNIKKETQALNDQQKILEKTSNTVQQYGQAKATAANKKLFNKNDIVVLDAADQKARELGNAFKNAGFSAELFGARIAEIGKRFSGFFVWTTVLFKLMGAIKETAESLKALDDAATEISKVLRGETKQSIDGIVSSMVNLSVETRRSFSEVSTSMKDFVRTGISADEALKATHAAMNLLNVSTVDASTAQKLLTTTVNSMGVSWDNAAQKVAVFSNLADTNAVLVDDLAHGFIRAGAAAATFGVTTEELASMIATIGGQTQLAATNVGTGLKTILVNIAKNRQAIIELIATQTGYTGSITDLESKYKTVSQTIQYAAESWNILGDSEKTAIAKLAGGARRFTELAALLQSNEKYLDNVRVANEKSNSVMEKSAIEAQSLAAAHRGLQASLTQFAKILQDIGATTFYKSIINGLSSVIGAISDGITYVENFSKGLGDWADFIRGGVSSFNLIKNAVIVLFAQVLLPQIQKATQSFMAFFSASKAGIEKIIGIENQRGIAVTQINNKYATQNALLEKQVKLQQQVGAATKTTATAGGATTGGAVDAAIASRSAKTTQLMEKYNKVINNGSQYISGLSTSATQTSKTLTGILANSIGNASKDLVFSFKEGVNAVRRIKYSLIDASTSVKNFAGSLGKLSGVSMLGAFNKIDQVVGAGATKLGGIFKNLSESGGFQIAKTMAILQTFDALSGGLSSLSQKASEAGDQTLAASTDFASSVVSGAGALAAFGPQAAAIGGILAGLKVAFGAVAENVKQSNALAAEEHKSASLIVDSQELVAIAQRDYAVAQGLVSQGLARFADDFSAQGLSKNIIIDAEKLPLRINVEVLKAGGVAAIKKEINDMIAQSETFKEKWLEAIETIKEGEEFAKTLKNILATIGKEKINIEAQFVSKDFGEVSTQLREFSQAVEDIKRQGISLSVKDKTGIATTDLAKPYELLKDSLLDVKLGLTDIENIAGEWGKSIAVSTPTIEKLKKQLEEVKKTENEMIKRFEFFKRQVEGADIGIGVSLENVKPLNEAMDAFRAASKEAAAGGEIKADSEAVKKMAEHYAKIAQMSGKTVPGNIRDIIALKLQEKKIDADNLDRWDIINEVTGVQVEKAKELFKLAEDSLRQNDIRLKLEEQMADAKKEAAKAAFEDVLNIYKAVEIAKVQTETNNRLLSQEKERLQELIKSEIASNNLALSAALYGTNMSKSATAAQKVSAKLAENKKSMEDLVRSARQLALEKVEEASTLGIPKEEIQPILRNIQTKLDLELTKKSEDSVKALSEIVRANIEDIKSLETERFAIVKSEIEKAKSLEIARGEIGKSVVSSFVKAAESAKIKDTEISRLINTGVIKDQLSTVGNEISRTLSNSARIELAYAYQQIDVNTRAKIATLEAEKERANAVERTIVKSKIVEASEQSRHDKSVALAKAMERSVTDAFTKMEKSAQTATESLNKMVKIRADIQTLDKEILKLKHSLRVEVPDNLARQAAQKEYLKEQNKEISQQIEHVRAVQAVNQQLEAQKRALEEAKESSRSYVESIKKELGFNQSVINAFQSITIASETMASKLFDAENAIVTVRANSAKEALDIFKSEYDKLKGFGESLFSAGPAQIRKLSQANAILQNSSLSVSETLARMPDYLKDAASQILKLRFGAAGEEMIAKAGLERAGIDPAILDQLKSSILTSAQTIANQQVQMVAQQQKSNDGTDFLISSMERQIRQNDLNIEESEAATKKIEELNSGQKDSTENTKQQLRDAIEQRKVLQAQLKQETDIARTNLQTLDRIDPGMRALVTGMPEQTAAMKSMLTELNINTKTLSQLGQSLQKFAEKSIAKAEVALGGAEAVSLQDEALVQAITNNSGASVLLTEQINALKINNDTLNQALNNSIIEYKNFKDQITSLTTVVQELAQSDLGSDAVLGILQESAADNKTIINNTQVMSEVATENLTKTQLVADNTKLSADNLTQIKTDNTNALKTLIGIQTETQNTKQAISNLGDGATLKSIVVGLSNVQNSIDKLKINIAIQAQQAADRFSNKATGLSSPEMTGLMNAAKKEKSRMPVGSDLVIANSSELVMTPKQAAKVFGQVNIPDTSFTNPRVTARSSVKLDGAETIPFLIKKVDALLSQQQNLLDMASNKKLFTNEQNIKINLEGKKELQIKGIAELGGELDSILKKHMAKVSTKAESAALRATLSHIVRRLREQGIDGF